MLYTLITLFVVLLAAYVAYRALKLLVTSSWFVGFCRGLFGLGLLTLAAVLAAVGWDVYSYKQMQQEQVVATISIEQIEAQHFDLRVVDKEGKEALYTLRGDQWQLDARIIKWKGYATTLGLKPAYRIERLSGRYFDIEQETTAKRTAYAINQSYYGLDVWALFNKNPKWVPVMDAVYGSSTYLPMKDKALFEVSISHTGLLARPLNDAAREAVNLLDDH